MYFYNAKKFSSATGVGAESGRFLRIFLEVFLALRVYECVCVVGHLKKARFLGRNFPGERIGEMPSFTPFGSLLWLSGKPLLLHLSLHYSRFCSPSSSLTVGRRNFFHYGLRLLRLVVGGRVVASKRVGEW